MVAVIIIIGILSVVALPRFSSSGAAFDEVKLYDQTISALRHGQRTAIAYQRTVCAGFTSTQMTMTYASAYGGACNTSLPPPGGTGGNAQYTVTAQGQASYSGAPFSVSFDRIGRPSGAATVSLAGGRTIQIEPETGYVR